MANSSYILITGGSSGIGLETAILFASKGFHVLITSLDEKELEIAITQIKASNNSVSVVGLTIDLSKEGSVQQLYDWAKSVTPNLDIVINNAGFGTFGFIDDVDMNRELEMINLMVKNLYVSTRLFLHDMIRHNKGTIINISSISAFQPNPTLATYGASKAFVYNCSITFPDLIASVLAVNNAVCFSRIAFSNALLVDPNFRKCDIT